MARGQQSLNSAITGEIKPEKINYGKGRNTDLLDKRNKAIFYRYYYYIRLCKLRYDEAVRLLAIDFFLTGDTIGKILVKNQEMLAGAAKENLSVDKLDRMFPAYKWNKNLTDTKKGKTNVVFVEHKY